MKRTLCLLTLCFVHSVQAAPDTIWLTVFVHGTYGIRTQLTLKNFPKILKDTLLFSPRKKVVDQIRSDPYFFQIQAIQDLGLQKIKPCKQRCSAASLFATLFEELSESPTTTKNLYYTFGWSGLLSHRERCDEAKKFYAALYKEVTHIKKTYPKASVHIRIMGYSHGGSVALHLAQHYQETKPLTVDELILIATPIQYETEELIQHELFEKVYSFYSRKDLIQAFDCFSQHNLFSRRSFKKRCLHDKLVEIEIKIMDAKYPDSSQYRINRSANHTEWWFFGWTLSSYRKEFMTYPLPLALFVPNFLRIIQATLPDRNHIKITLHPDGNAHIKAKKHGHCCHAQWIEPDTLEKLQEYAYTHEPETMCHKEHKSHVKHAYKSTPEGLQKLHEKHSKACQKKSKQTRICSAGTYNLP